MELEDLLQARTTSAEASTNFFLTQLASLLARKRLDVRLLNLAEYAYIEDGWRISISKSKPGLKIKDIHTDRRVLASYKGFTYHEVGHVRFDSYRGQPPSYLRHTLNILRDQQLEVRFVVKYPGVADYFRLNIGRFLPTDKPGTYGLVYGRRSFLPKKLVAAAKKTFVAKYDEVTAKKMEAIIDKFLVATDDYVMDSLADKFWELFKDDNVVPSLNVHIYEVYGGKDPLRDHTKREQREIDEANDEIQEMIDEEDLDEDPDELVEEGESSLMVPIKDDVEGADEDYESLDSDSGDITGDMGDEGDEDEDTEEPDIGGGSGTPSLDDFDGDSEKPGSLQDAANDLVDDAFDSVTIEISQDLASIQDKTYHDKVKKYDIDENVHGNRNTYDVPFTDDVKRDAIDLAQELKKMVNELKPGYVPESKRGVPDFPAIKRHQAKGTRSTRVFRQFKASRIRAVKIAVSLVVDVSGSLSSQRDAIHKAVSVMMLALEELPNVKFNLIYFATGTDISVRFRDSKKKRSSLPASNVGGSTHITNALKIAIEELRTLPPDYEKYCFIFSDGGWNNWDSEVPRLARQIRSLGSKLVYIRAGSCGDAEEMPWSHISKDVIHGSSSALRTLKNLITIIVRENLKKVVDR